MNPLRFLAAAALTSVSALAAAQDKPATAITSKFGFVNTERILRDAVPAQRAQKKIEAEFQKRDQELAQVVEQANRVIRQIAEQEKFDIIFQDAVFASPRIDITDKVIKALDQGKPPAK